MTDQPRPDQADRPETDVAGRPGPSEAAGGPAPDEGASAAPDATSADTRAPESAADSAAAGGPQQADPGAQGRPGQDAADSQDASESGTASPGQEGAGGDQDASEPRSGSADAPDDERSAEELRAALDEAERAAQEYLDHLRRERAEFDNFRKRSTKERMEALDKGAESLVASLLGVLDNFGYTLEAARASSDDKLAKGVEMVHTELRKVLTDAGLEDVPGVGAPFDPAVHEAMFQVDAADELGEAVDDPVVVEVLRPGYRFKGRVLRPAAVKVAR